MYWDFLVVNWYNLIKEVKNIGWIGIIRLKCTSFREDVSHFHYIIVNGRLSWEILKDKLISQQSFNKFMLLVNIQWQNFDTLGLNWQ